MRESIKQIYLWGGLGNVLYQINLAYFLYECGYNVQVNKGLLDYNNLFIRKSIKVHKGVYDRVNLFVDSNKIEIINNLSFKDVFYLIAYKFGFTFKFFKFFNHDWPIDYDVINVNNFFGYFQKTNNISFYLSKSFYLNFKSNINKEILDLVVLDSTILIHARFGDKIDVSEFDVNYFNIYNIVKEYQTIVVVTDDIQNAKLINFDSKTHFDLIFVCSENIIDDFYLISSAKAVVISRSSFSWWATEISVIDQKIFQPSPFYNHVEWQLFSNKVRIGYET